MVPFTDPDTQPLTPPLWFGSLKGFGAALVGCVGIKKQQTQTLVEHLERVCGVKT